MAKKSLRCGIFITFEGVEGCGKSTHARLVHRALKRLGYPSMYTKEPGGTKIGDKIRRILLDTKNTSLAVITELFLFEASRSEVVDKVITPALRRKMVVICDRFFDATMAYQGYGSGLNKNNIKSMTNFATKNLKPDLTIILDISIKKGLYRAGFKNGKDRMEKRPVSYHKRVRKGYRDIAKREPGRVRLISTMKDVDDTHTAVMREVLNVIRRYKAAG